MKALVLSSARLREQSLLERFDYYARLLKTQLPLAHRQVKANSLLKHIPKDWVVVTLDERGEELTSVAFSKRLGKVVFSGASGIVFVVGDADGLTAEVRERADWSLSLSKLTLPHQLCFVVLAEQLYRAFTIMQGGKYHRK